MAAYGLLLAAGSGTRFGGPKALARDPDGTSWLLRALGALRPCDQITVVLGASADEAAALLPMSVERVLANDWETGMGASLRAGLAHAQTTEAEAAVVTLVDLPDVDAAVIGRLLGESYEPSTLRRATYDGVPGHPVLLGREHWQGVIESATGDQGARAYLAAHRAVVESVECGDLASGADVDTPD